MRRLLVHQKLLSLRGRFTVTDDADLPVYTVEGSFLQIPKQFTIRDTFDRDVARVTKTPFSWLPHFTVEIGGTPRATIQKRFTLLRPRYEVHGPGITVQGDLWEMSFELQRDGAPIGRVDKKWLSVRDRYAIEIERDEDEVLVLGIVLAIDYVKQSDQAAVNTSATGG